VSAVQPKPNRFQHERILVCRTRRVTAAAVRCGSLIALLVLTACQGVLDPQGPVGEADKTILIDSLAIMLAIVVPTIIATLGFAWWYRSSNTKAAYRPNFVYSGQLELIVWAIPLLTIMLLGGVAWVSSHDLDPANPLPSKQPTLTVLIYPDQHVASVNQLVIPAGVPVHFELTSASVMNAFFIPELGSMIYTMNGMRTQLNLSADAPGDFPGLSSHYSGDGFSTMHFDVKAVPAEQFTAWVNATRQTGSTLTEQSYPDLAKQSLSVAPFTYRDVAPDLFQKIVSQALPPGPGPINEVSAGANSRAGQ